MIVVLDSNVWLSALLFPGRQCDLLRSELLKRRITLTISDPIILEICGVLRKKFRFSEKEVAQLENSIRWQTLWVAPTEVLSIVKTDDADNRILECALESAAKIVVSGDRDLLRLKKYKSIQILSPRELLDILKV